MMNAIIRTAGLTSVEQHARNRAIASIVYGPRRGQKFIPHRRAYQVLVDGEPQTGVAGSSLAWRKRADARIWADQTRAYLTKTWDGTRIFNIQVRPTDEMVFTLREWADEHRRIYRYWYRMENPTERVAYAYQGVSE